MMVNYFNDIVEKSVDGHKSAIRALQAWQYLIGKASNRQVIRYDELKTLMDYQTNNPLTPALGCIMYYCMQNELPPLTIIIVNQKGIPGSGFTVGSIENYHFERERVFGFQWFKVVPPTVEDFREAYREGKKELGLKDPQ